MFILNKNKDAIINMDQLNGIYLGADNCSIKADYQNGKGCQLGRYNSEASARIALAVVAERMGKSEVVSLPDDQEVEVIFQNTVDKSRYHHATGKKTKGHGGS